VLSEAMLDVFVETELDRLATSDCTVLSEAMFVLSEAMLEVLLEIPVEAEVDRL
jgi:hypothetical protein